MNIVLITSVLINFYFIVDNVTSLWHFISTLLLNHANDRTFQMIKMKEFARDESGATAIEYGLIAALVSVAAITAMSALGTSLTGIFNEVSTQLDASY